MVEFVAFPPLLLKDGALSQSKAKEKADPSLTTPELKNVRGPVRSG
jgi:hypothetical protein